MAKDGFNPCQMNPAAAEYLNIKIVELKELNKKAGAE